MNAVDPREILSYLNDLGYVNITAEQLKAFIKDLKKLIKYEQRKDLEVDESSDFSRFSEIFTYLYSTGTIASKAKETKKHENIITVEVKRPKKDRRILTDICLDKDNYCTSKINNKTAGNECQDTALEKEDKFMKSKSAGRTSARSGQSRVTIKPKASFIRPKINLKTSKSDPVALYHQYQAEWKKQRFPGEDNRSDLRWAIREKMMGDCGERAISTAASCEGLSKKKRSASNV